MNPSCRSIRTEKQRRASCKVIGGYSASEKPTGYCKSIFLSLERASWIRSPPQRMGYAVNVSIKCVTGGRTVCPCLRNCNQQSLAANNTNRLSKGQGALDHGKPSLPPFSILCSLLLNLPNFISLVIKQSVSIRRKITVPPPCRSKHQH